MLYLILDKSQRLRSGSSLKKYFAQCPFWLFLTTQFWGITPRELAVPFGGTQSGFGFASNSRIKAGPYAMATLLHGRTDFIADQVRCGTHRVRGKVRVAGVVTG